MESVSMDDVDSRGQEAMLSDSPNHDAPGPGIVHFSFNLASVDSGVETGNDSNDSSSVQQDGQQQQAAGRDLRRDDHMIMHMDMSELAAFMHSSLFLPGEPRLSPFKTEIDRLLQRKRLFKTKVFPTLGKQKSCQLSKASAVYRHKMRERMFRTLHKDMIRLFSDVQIERVEQKMRFAATTNNVDLIKKLLDFGVSPNNQDEHGRTPLHISACRGYTKIVSLLLENGADPNKRDCIGNTPLHLATVNSKLSVVMPLLTAGTDVLALDSYGYNPLQLAKTKLRMLQRNCNNEDMLKVKEEMHDVINMLMAYLQKQNNTQKQVETLSNFCSRLSLSNTSNQVQDDVKDLLANINALNITD
ncbi:PREDICTED: ankyrin repeat domain-containing protein 54-like isoform X2 [Vollenhovia emeryi]|uniref:ankyrin repeat domain-containing protein 54-like isoform X2 n=1 Tax=Vollenhovia emeryi TaxID=411798 RepID=UPI0005F51642|nr:PREDICTED: ankyrin repeat domain-containing protein 54-like isoform X2 [Vollenhovia emeryi]